jgi:hypothetical protein
MNAKGFGQPIYKLNSVGIDIGDEVNCSGVIVCNGQVYLASFGSVEIRACVVCGIGSGRVIPSCPVASSEKKMLEFEPVSTKGLVLMEGELNKLLIIALAG